MRAAIVLLLGLAAGPALSQDDHAAAVRHQAAEAGARARALEQQAKATAGEAARTLDHVSLLASRIVTSDNRIAAARHHLARIARARSAQRRRLAEAQAPVVRIGAALQLLARRPPALSLINPGSVAQLVHIRALLDAVVPAIAARTKPLQVELAEGTRLDRAAQATVRQLRLEQRALAQDRRTMIRLAVARQERATGFDKAALSQSDRVLALTATAEDLDEAGLQAKHGRLLAADLGHVEPLPGPVPGGRANLGNWRWPVRGRLVSGMGALTPAGLTSHGVTLAAPGEPIIAPAAGTVIFAGLFHGYGQVLILAHPGDWTTLIAGLRRTLLRPGMAVFPGRTIGRADREVLIEVRHHGAPVDIAALAARG